MSTGRWRKEKFKDLRSDVAGSEIELYARGLALAEGHARGGRRRSLVIGMGRSAEPVLSKIAAAMGSVNGVRHSKRNGQVTLTLSELGWWKHSTEGLDTIHAFRGFIDGDGCVCRRFYGRKAGGKYISLIIKIYILEKELPLLAPWLNRCLRGYRFHVNTNYRREAEAPLSFFVVSGSEAVRLWKNVYGGARISLKGDIQEKFDLRKASKELGCPVFLSPSLLPKI